MTVSKVDVLRAEIGMLEEMLRELGDGRIIERMGLKERMRILQAEIETLQPAGHRFALTFRGEPVEGSRSIAADFAGRALTAFSEAVATIAASFRGELRSTGPLPNHADSQGLRIVGPALGSFGFELEIPPVAEPQPLLWANEDPRALAVERAMRLVDAARSDDDEALSELIADVHVRARAKVLEFVRCVVDHRATFRVRLGDKESGLRELEEGQRVLRALRQEDVLEKEIDLRGQLWVLPVGRQFELHSENSVVRGRIDPCIARPDELRSGVSVVAHLRETQLRLGKPRLTLTEVRIEGSEAEALTPGRAGG